MNHLHRHRGTALIYCSVLMVALIGLISLAVDWGRAQTAKQELRNAVDAAARYAAAGLSDNTCLTKAQQAAAQNSVDGSTLVLLPADVETGTWDTTTRSFVPNGVPKNTVRVTGVRTAARGTAVPLVFARIVGATSIDVTAQSVARQSSLAAVGINAISLTGTGLVRRKSTEGGGVTTASNGAYTMSGSSAIYGDALYRTAAPTGVVTGQSYALPADFAFAAPTVPGGATTYSSISLSSGNNPIAGNIYVTGDLYVGGTAIVTLNGDTSLYCGGNVTFTGSISVVTNGYRLFVYSVGTGSINFSNTLSLPAIIYAPTSPVVLAGPGGVTGSAVAKSLSIGCTLDYSAVSAIPFKATGGNEIMDAGGVITVK